jgi:hypothetical protein
LYKLSIKKKNIFQKKVAVTITKSVEQYVKERAVLRMKNVKEVTESTRERPKRDSLLQTSLLMLGSALFGGIAVAFWNRRTLASMQDPKQQAEIIPITQDDDVIY